LYLPNVYFCHPYKLFIIIITLLRTHHILHILLHKCTKVFISIDRIAPVELMLFNSLGFSISRSINYSAVQSFAYRVRIRGSATASGTTVTHRIRPASTADTISASRTQRRLATLFVVAIGRENNFVPNS